MRSHPRIAWIAAGLAVSLGLGVLLLVSRRASEQDPAAIAAVATYPIANRMNALAQMDGRGRAAVCHRGSPALALGDVTAKRVYFVDGDLKALPLPCVGATPRTIVRLRDLLGRAPRTSEGIGVLETLTNPRESPDGKRLAFELSDCGGEELTCTSRIYLTGPDGGASRVVADHQLLGWADAGHVVSALALWDPVAVDVDSKQQRFLAFPRAWLGKMTPDGRRARYRLPEVAKPSLRGLYDEGVYEIDRAAATKRRITIDPDVLNGSPDRTGGRSVELVGESTDSGPALIRVYGSRGDLVKVFESPIPRTGDCDPNLGWFDARRAWVFDACGAALVDLDSGRVTKLTMPELDPSGHTDPETALHAIYERLSSPVEDPTVQGPGRPSTSAVPGVTLTLPPSWRAVPCTCGPRSYRSAVLIAGEEPMLSFQGVGYELTVAVTGHAPDRVLRALRSEYATGRMPPGMRAEPIERVATRTQRVGTISMTALDLRSGADATDVIDTVLVGRSGSRTYVITLYAEGRIDPSVRFILNAVRFTG